MTTEEDTPEVAAIKSRIESCLDAQENKLNIDLTKESIEFQQHSGNLFTGNKNQVAITLGFKDDSLAKTSSLEQLRSNFNFIALDRLPVPGLNGISSEWQIYPQTSLSSFSEGVTLEQYDPNTQVLQLNVQTGFFAIYGIKPQPHPIACGPSPKGTYLQVRREIQGLIQVHAKLVFSS